MAESLFSPSWYRVAKLKPRLRRHAQIHRHQYRGETWYVLQDHSSERYHRFSPAAYLILGLMDGTRTVADVWEAASSRLGDDAPTQDEMIQLLTQLQPRMCSSATCPRSASHSSARRWVPSVGRRVMAAAT